ncbi:MAG: YtxH domain-containing protein [Bacteroidetes bacterium]|nr:YtxH domain-containing protein [Bacteroidota bacterium]
MKSGKVLLGVLSGIAVGALIGILFAPDKGSRTRRRIITKGDDYADALKDKFDEFVDKVGDKFEKAKDEAGDMFTKNKANNAETKNAAH